MDTKKLVIIGGAIGLGAAAAYALKKNGTPPGTGINGYWDLEWDVPRDGQPYACFATLYKWQDEDGGTQFNMRWNLDLWDLDLSVAHYYPGTNPHPEPLTPPIPNSGFPEEEWDGAFSDYFSAEPYQYTSTGPWPVKWPAIPPESGITLLELFDTGTTIRAVIQTRNADIEPVPNYFTETL